MAGALLIGGTPVGTFAQGPQIIRDDPSCPKCTIDFEFVVTLGSPGGPGALSVFPGPISLDARGRYYVLLADRAHEMPFVFRPDGSLLTRLGKEGEGPGEFLRPRDVAVGRSDTVYIYDSGTLRVTVLSPDYALARTFRAPPSGWDGAVRDDGRIVFSARVATADRIGLALHEYRPDGAWVRSFEDYSDLTGEFRHTRFLHAGPSGLWSVPDQREYAIRLWDDSESPVRTLVREAEWYRPYETWRPGTPGRPPDPMIRGLWEDGRGLVWTVAQVAAIDWAQGLGTRTRAEGQDYYPVEDPLEVYDGLVEVLDPDAARLVTSARIDAPIHWVLAPRLIASVREGSVGWWYADVYRVRLIKR